MNDFEQRDVGGASLSNIDYERATYRSTAGIELADAPGDHIDQDVGIAHFREGLFNEFSVHQEFLLT